MITTEQTLIHATHRPEDLIPAFVAALQEQAPDRAANLLAICENAHVLEKQRRGVEDWARGSDAYYLLDDLFEALNAACPEGFYFGAHPGDGSDYGWWRIGDDE